MRKLSSNCCPSSVDRCDALMEETESCTLESAVRGHHVYKTTWSPAIGQVLQVGAEDSNAYDRYAVATCLRDTVVGHMPRELSRIAWHFLQHRGCGFPWRPWPL